MCNHPLLAQYGDEQYSYYIMRGRAGIAVFNVLCHLPSFQWMVIGYIEQVMLKKNSQSRKMYLPF